MGDQVSSQSLSDLVTGKRRADPYVGAARAALGQGLGMGWGDEAEAWLRERLGQGSYEDQLKKIRGEYSEYSKEHPVISGAAEFGGGAAPGIAMMMVPGAQAAGAQQLARSGAGALGRLAAIGAGTGAVAGAGTAEEDRLSGGLGGAAIGGTLGAAIPIAMKGASAGGKWLMEKMWPTEKRVARAAAEKMTKALGEARTELSAHAPRIESLQIDKSKIRDIIGTGGKVIREIVATTGAKVDIDDEGTVKISSSDIAQIEAAKAWILGIVEEAEVGKVYDGKVVNIVDFGAFVNFMGGKDGLVHVSEMKNERVEKPTDVVSEGQEVFVKVLEIDPRGKVRLSMRVVDQETGEELEDTRPAAAPRGDRGDRGDRGPRRDGEGRGDRGRGGRDRGPRRDDDRGPRRERSDRDDGPAPEFAPAFLTKED